jgi:hypothetical protein
MDLRQFAGRFEGVHWLGDQKFRSQCPCLTHNDGDPELSLIARESNGRILLACIADQGDSTDSILTTIGLTAADLRISIPEATVPAAALSTNGTTHYSNGKLPDVEAVTDDTPSLSGGWRTQRARESADSGRSAAVTASRDFGKWQLEVGYRFKHWFTQVPDQQRELLASTEEDTLVETLVTQAKDWITAQKSPLWPLPELNESEVDEELHRLAVKIVQAFRDDYLPAIAEEHLPAVPGHSVVICETAEQAELSNQEYMSRAASVAQLYYERAISLGVGGKHEGKTTATRTEALAIAAGEEVYGRATLQQPVIYAASDDEYATTRMELLRMGWLRRRLPLRLVKINASENPEPEQILAEIARIAEVEGSRFVILDMLFDFIRVQDEIKYAQTRTAVGRIQTLADEINGHVKATHHSPKWMPDATTAAKAALGSQGIVAKFSPVLLSKKWTDELYTIESTMTRDPRGLPIRPLCITRDNEGWARPAGDFKPWMKWRMYAERIIGLLEGGEEGRRMSVAQVMEALAISRVETQNALYQMSRPGGQLERERAGKGYQYFLKTNDLFSDRTE